MFEDVTRIIGNINQGNIAPVYLIIGDEEYLIGKVKNTLLSLLLPGDKKNFNLESINDASRDFENEVLNAISTISLFKERKVVVAYLPSKSARTASKLDKLEDYFDKIANRQTQNILILCGCNVVDKRSKLFKKIKDCGEVIEFPHLKDIRSWTPEIENQIFRLVGNEVKKAGKTIKKDAYQLLLERTDHDLRSMFCELDKLILYIGKENEIRKRDIIELVEETTQMAFYALGEAIGKRNANDILKTIENFLGSAKSPVYILQLMFDNLKNMKNIKEILQLPVAKNYKQSWVYRGFSFNYLSPLLEKKKNGIIESRSLQELLSLKPYRIFMLFKQTDRFEENEIDSYLVQIKEIDKKMKSSTISPESLLYNLATEIAR